MKLLQGALPPAQLEVRELADSYHVATLDHDAEVIFSGSLEFIRLHSGITTESTGGE